MFNRHMLLNSMLFNIAWFGCVVLGDKFGVVVLIWAAIHLYHQSSFKSEFFLVVIVTLLGCFIDSTLMHFSVLAFNSDSHVIPFWLMMIWLAFSLTINGCLKPLQSSIPLQWFIGVIFPPLSYISGSALGDVSFNFPVSYTFAIFSILWCCLLPMLFYINRLIKEGCKHD